MLKAARDFTAGPEAKAGSPEEKICNPLLNDENASPGAATSMEVEAAYEAATQEVVGGARGGSPDGNSPLKRRVDPSSKGAEEPATPAAASGDAAPPSPPPRDRHVGGSGAANRPPAPGHAQEPAHGPMAAHESAAAAVAFAAQSAAAQSAELGRSRGEASALRAMVAELEERLAAERRRAHTAEEARAAAEARARALELRLTSKAESAEAPTRERPHAAQRPRASPGPPPVPPPVPPGKGEGSEADPVAAPAAGPATSYVSPFQAGLAAARGSQDKSSGRYNLRGSARRSYLPVPQYRLTPNPTPCAPPLEPGPSMAKAAKAAAAEAAAEQARGQPKWSCSNFQRSGLADVTSSVTNARKAARGAEADAEVVTLEVVEKKAAGSTASGGGGGSKPSSKAAKAAARAAAAAEVLLGQAGGTKGTPLGGPHPFLRAKRSFRAPASAPAAGRGARSASVPPKGGGGSGAGKRGGLLFEIAAESEGPRTSKRLKSLMPSRAFGY